jgi:hypothetical protein
LVELSVDAFQASETLVSELAVMRRFVGVVGACLSPGDGGRFAGAAAVSTSASTNAAPASAAVRMDMALPVAVSVHEEIRAAESAGLPSRAA